MRFESTPIEGSFLVSLDKIGDDRGFFARAFCAEEFAKRGLTSSLVQANTSFSAEMGTLRGLHYQLPPHEEMKLVRCVRGKIWDVVLDLRSGSPTFGHHFGAELSHENRLMMIVPEGCAHGFLSLEEGCEVLYWVSSAYAPKFERGIRWNDPRFSVQWPFEPRVLSPKDSSHPDFDPTYHLSGVVCS